MLLQCNRASADGLALGGGFALVMFCCDGGGRVTASRCGHITSKYQDWELSWEHVWSHQIPAWKMGHRSSALHGEGTHRHCPGLLGWQHPKVLMGSHLKLWLKEGNQSHQGPAKRFLCEFF